jgi:hemoglobin/transferrin/lactoferrin receptor protein
MANSFIRAALAGSTFLVSTNLVLAQDAGDVSLEEAAGTGYITLDKITIFGDRQGRKPLDATANISVIDEEQLDDQAITDMQELVRYEPGIEVSRQTSGADPFNTFGGFQIRGVGGNRVQMLVDGGRVPERIIDGTRDYLDFNFTKQVDIVRGPGSVLWGADALGGIVALETIDPEDYLVDGKTFGGEAEIAYNSLDDEINTSLTAAHKLSDQVSVVGGISFARANEAEYANARADGGIYGCPRNVSLGATPCNELDPTDKKSYRGLAKMVLTPNDDHRIEITADHMQRYTDVDYDQVLGPQYNMTTGLPTGEVVHNYDRELEIKRSRFGIEHDWNLDSRFVENVKWNLSYTPHGYERTGVETKTSAGGDDIIEEDLLRFNEDFIEFDAQLTSRFELGDTDHTVTWGFDGDITYTDYKRTDIVRNLTTGTTTETSGGGFNFANATTTRADFYIQDQIEMFGGALEITPGVRYATYNLDPRTDSDYQVVPGSEPTRVSKGAALFAIGADLDLTENYSVYAAFNQGFKMPTAQQLYTSLPGFFNLIPAPDLRPETVNNYEIGLRGEFERGFFSVNAFYADYTDFIQSFYFVPNTNDITYRNLSYVELYGIEASAGLDITDNLAADFSFAWQQGTQKASEDADAVDFTAPPLKAVVGLNYTIPDYDLTLGATTTLVSAVTRTDSADDFRPDGYALLDLGVKWQPTENTKLRFGVKNVFNERYFQSAASSYGITASDAVARTNPIELQTGPGRTFEFGLNVTF